MKKLLFSTLVAVSIFGSGKAFCGEKFTSLNQKQKRQAVCLAENIYFEARGEPLEGQIGVAYVTINRVRSGNYAKDICGVIREKTKFGVCQFSWWCERKKVANKDKIKSTDEYKDILEFASNFIVNYKAIDDLTKGATYYHAKYVNPRWKYKRLCKIGTHIFYRDPEDIIDQNKKIV